MQNNICHSINDDDFFGAMSGGDLPYFLVPAKKLAELFAPNDENSDEDDDTPFVRDDEEDSKSDPKEHLINGVNVLAAYDLVPLCGNHYHTSSFAKVDGKEVKIILIKNAADDKQYFLYESDDYRELHPFDSVIFHEGWHLYKNWEPEVYYNSKRLPEFIYNGKDLLAERNLAPWYVDEKTLDPDTGDMKIVSWYRFDGERLEYKTIRNQKFYLLRSEDFKTAYWYRLFMPMRYGTKILDGKGLRYELSDPKEAFYLECIQSYNEAFLDIISYEGEYRKDPEKYKLLKKTIFKLLENTISADCNCDRKKIRIHHKTISCIFKRNGENIWQRLDTPAAPAKTQPKQHQLFTKMGMPRKLRTEKRPGKQPEKQPAASSQQDVLAAIEKFTIMINYGKKPDRCFYDCDSCPLKPVCIYTEEMEKYRAELEGLYRSEQYEQYLKKHGNQIPLYPEIIFNDQRYKTKG